MLVIYQDQGDGTGIINQCIVQSQFTLDVLAERYKAEGIPCIVHDGTGDIFSSYVKDGAVVPKEEVTVTGDIRQLKADGVDALTLTVAPLAFNVSVLSAGKLIHQEQETNGQLVLSVDHPGTYTVVIDPGHPYLTKQFDIEAVA